MSEQVNERISLVIGFESNYPKRVSRQLQCDGRGLHVFYKNNFTKVCYLGTVGNDGGEFILESLLTR